MLTTVKFYYSFRPIKFLLVKKLFETRRLRWNCKSNNNDCDDPTSRWSFPRHPNHHPLCLTMKHPAKQSKWKTIIIINFPIKMDSPDPRPINMHSLSGSHFSPFSLSDRCFMLSQFPDIITREEKTRQTHFHQPAATTTTTKTVRRKKLSNEIGFCFNGFFVRFCFE